MALNGLKFLYYLFFYLFAKLFVQNKLENQVLLKHNFQEHKSSFDCSMDIIDICSMQSIKKCAFKKRQTLLHLTLYKT